MRKKSSDIAIYLLVLFILVAVIVYIVQITDIFSSTQAFQATTQQANPGTAVQSKRELIFFNLINFICLTGIGWCLQSLYSKKQYQNELKRYAISAYRRIHDIFESVSVLKSSIMQTKNQNLPAEYNVALDSCYNMAEIIAMHVKSAASDWSDAITEELILKEKYDEIGLQIQKIQSSPNHSTDPAEREKRVERLIEEQEKLRSELPLKLIEGSQYNDIRTVLESLNARIKHEGFVLLDFEFLNANITEIKKSDILYLVIIIETDSIGVKILLNKEIVGSVINPYNDFGINDRNFAHALSDFLKNLSLNVPGKEYYHGHAKVEYRGPSEANPDKFFQVALRRPIIKE